MLLQLLDVNREQGGKWLAVALESLPVQSNGIVTATPQQIKDIHSSIIRLFVRYNVCVHE